MAITKLLKIKSAKTGHPSSGLKQCLHYIANPDKTEGLILTGGSSGGDPDLTYEDMLSNKQSWDKTVGTQGYHYILSLPPDENPDNETMRALTEDFCKELLQDRHLYAYAIHTDRGHLHSHIVFDSVSCDDGHMWHSGRYDWLGRIQPIADRLCAKYGLHSLNFDPKDRKERQNKTHTEWETEKDDPLHIKRDVTWADIIRADVDKALSKSRTWSDFIIRLLDMHYEIKDGKHLSLKPKGKERSMRSGRLGEEYTKDSLIRRLGEQVQEATFGDAESILQALREYLQKTGQKEIKGIKTVYFQRWYSYSYINKSSTPWRYRSALTELGKYTDRCAYLFKHDISSYGDLQQHLSSLREKQVSVKKELIRTNNQIYNTPISAWRKLEKLRAELDTASELEKPKIQHQIDNIVDTLKNTDMATEAEKYRALQEKKRSMQEASKKVSAELKMVKDLVSDYEKAKSPEDIMQDPSRFIPDPFTAGSYRRITINKVLFRNTPDDSDFMKVKIPGQNEYLLLYRNDTKVAEDGSYASSYLYTHLNYKMVDKDNRFTRTISGAEAMTLFTDRTRERKNTNVR